MNERTMNITTKCGPCVFASTDEYGHQVGCTLGKLEKFRENGIEITRDELGESVVNTFCTFCRDEKWLGDRTLDEAFKTVREQISLQADVVIVVPDEAVEYWHQLEALEDTLTSIGQMSLKPKSVVITSNNKVLNNEVLKVVEWLNKRFTQDDLKGVKFFFIKSFENDADSFRLLDMGVRKCTHTFYTLAISGQKLVSDYLEKLDKALNDDMRRIVMIEGETIHGLTVMRNLHLALSGSFGLEINKKIQQLSLEQNSPALITTWDNI